MNELIKSMILFGCVCTKEEPFDLAFCHGEKLKRMLLATYLIISNALCVQKL